MIDAARAAQRIPGLEVSDDVVLTGFSQGGHAVLFASELGQTYAPDLDITAVVALAPAADVPTLLGASASSPEVIGFAFLALTGWAETYDLDITQIFTEEAAARAADLEELCDVVGLFSGEQSSDILVGNVADFEDWREAVEANDATRVTPNVPVAVVHGEVDSIVAVELSDILVERLCGTGANVAMMRLPDIGHGEVIASSADAVVRWAELVRDEVDTPSSC